MPRLVNVRLDEERQRKVRALRDRGVVLSDVVRDAIDERFAALSDLRSPVDVQRVMRRMFEEFPDPPEQSSRPYDPHNRHAARAAIQRKLRRVKR